MRQDDGPQFISRKAVMKMVGLSYPTIWTMMVAGQFPRARRVGHRSMWLRRDVIAFIESRPYAPLKGHGTGHAGTSE